jgi:hypothetical protein
MFDPCKPFQPSLIFAGEARAFTVNIRLGWKFSPGTNTLAYYENLYITAVKSFIGLAPGVLSSKAIN